MPRSRQGRNRSRRPSRGVSHRAAVPPCRRLEQRAPPFRRDRRHVVGSGRVRGDDRHGVDRCLAEAPPGRCGYTCIAGMATAFGSNHAFPSPSLASPRCISVPSRDTGTRDQRPHGARRPAVVEGSGELSDARPFPEVGVPDTLDIDHLDQPFLQGGCGVEHRPRTGWRVKVVLL